jgi:hypothetical protein
MRLLGFPDRANFRRLVRDLVARGLVAETTVWAKPVPEMREPLFASDKRVTARIAGEHPDAGASIPIAEILRSARARWAGVSAVPTVALVATGRAGNRFGVRRFGRLTHPTQASHDLAVSQCLLALTAQDFNPQNWHGEDCTDICPIQDAVPDAIIVDAAGEPRTVIEVVGEHYDEPKLGRLGQECRRRGLDYQLW